MKNLPIIICIALAVSCSKPPPPDTTTATTPSDTAVAAPVYKEDDPYTLSQNGDTIVFKIKYKKVLSFKLPDSAKVEVTTGRYGTALADWEPNGLVTYKSFAFQVGSNYCVMPGDEGTSAERIDTLAYGPGFAHATFDNLVAGAYGIEELYDVINEGYCIRFGWTLGMSSDATPDDRKNEIRKMEEFLKTVKFEREVFLLTN